MAQNTLQSLARNVAVISGNVTNLECSGYCATSDRTDAMFLSPPQYPCTGLRDRRSWPTGKRFPGHFRTRTAMALAVGQGKSAHSEPRAEMSMGLKRG